MQCCPIELQVIFLFLISTVKRLFELFVHFLDVRCSFIWLLTSNHILVIIEVYVCLRSSCKSLIKAALSSCQMLSILELEYHHILNVFKSSVFQSGRKTGIFSSYSFSGLSEYSHFFLINFIASVSVKCLSIPFSPIFLPQPLSHLEPYCPTPFLA